MRLWRKRDEADAPAQEQEDVQSAAMGPVARRRGKPFRFEIGWSGLFGLIVVCFCLFLWMFLLGLWAGQTILLPPRDGARMTGAVRPGQVAAGEAPAPTKAPRAESKQVE